MSLKRILLVVILLAGSIAFAVVAITPAMSSSSGSCSTVPGDADCDCRVGISDLRIPDILSLVSYWGETCHSVRGMEKGITFVTWTENGYRNQESDESLSNLAATGANWIALVVTGYQETASSTVITRAPSLTPADADLIHVIDFAHSLGLKVLLKPHVDLTRDPNHWRGSIAFRNEADWSAWFAFYRDFINHYAELAQANGAEAFTVGVELEGASKREADWRRVAAEVRQRFSGAITYAANPGGEETNITWWDALDYIGVNAYYELASGDNPSVAEIKAAWQKYLPVLESLSYHYGRPVVFTEIGYRSIRGTSAIAGDWKRGEGRPIDLQGQADAYEAFFESVWDQPWFIGAYWWAWPADLSSGGPSDSTYMPYKKPAEQVIRSWYGGPAPDDRPKGTRQGPARGRPGA